MAVTVRTLSGQVPAAQVVVLRHAVGLVAMTSWFISQRKVPELRRPGLLLLRGLLGGGAVLTYFIAIEKLGAAAATVLNYISPVYAALWAALFLKERAGKLAFAGLGLATVGAVLVTLASTRHSPGAASLAGAVAGLISGVLGGAAMTTVKAARGDADAATVFLAFTVVGLLIGLPGALPAWVPLTGALWVKVVAIGFLAVAGQLLFTTGMGFTSATVGSATTQLVPVLAWGMAIFVLGEPVLPLAVGGALLCVGGVLLGMLPRFQR